MKIEKLIKINCIMCALLLTTSSFATCPYPEPRIQTIFTRSDIAFVGTVVSEREYVPKVETDDDPLGVYYKMKVKKVFRGPKQKYIEIYEDNNSARMGLDLNKTYFVFVKKNKRGMLQGHCDDAREIKDTDYEKTTSEILQIIKNEKNRTNGDICVFVVKADESGGFSPNGNGIGGIHFVIKGNGKAYKAVSDKDGWVHITVPPGHYKIEPIEPTMKVEYTPYTYDFPDDVDVRAGGGGDLEFVASPKK